MIERKVQETKKFYDKYPIADNEFRRGGSVLKSEDIQINLKELSKKEVLDCGCGPGNISAQLLDKVKDIKLTSLDISISSLKILKKRLKTTIKCNIIQGNVLSLPFKKEVFDFIIVAGVIHHTPKPFLALDNLNYVLKKSGKIYLSLYNKHSFYFLSFTHSVNYLDISIIEINYPIFSSLYFNFYYVK